MILYNCRTAADLFIISKLKVDLENFQKISYLVNVFIYRELKIIGGSKTN